MTPLRSVESRVRAVLADYVSGPTAVSVLRSATRRTGASLRSDELDASLAAEIERGLRVFVGEAAKLRECVQRLASLGGTRAPLPTEELLVTVRDEAGVVDARTRARELAKLVGFHRTDQAKIATSVSELARNIQCYARRGRVRLLALIAPRLGVRVVAEDEGPGIPNLEEVLSGSYRSPTGMGLGLRGCRNLMDEFAVETAPGRGTRVTLAKFR